MFDIFTITDPPEITTHLQNVTTRIGSHVTLSCNVKDNHLPSISWTRNRIVTATGDDSRISFTVQNRNLTIMNVSKADRGEYRCDDGNATSSAATLDVQCKFTECSINLNSQISGVHLNSKCSCD